MINKIIKLLTLSLFISLGFGQLTRFPWLPVGVNLYLADVLAVFLIIVYFTFFKSKKPPLLAKPITWFVLVAQASLILSLGRLPLANVAISSLYLIRLMAYSSLYWVFSDKQLKLNLPKNLITLSLIVAVLGIAQYLFLPDTRFLATLGWDDHYYRVISTFGDPSQVGLILLLGLILNFFTSKSKLVYITLIVPMFLTYSRSTYLAMAAVIISYNLIKKNWRSLLIGLSIIFLGILILPHPGGEGVNLARIYSITQRQENWLEAIDLAKNRPLLGVGFNTLRYTRRDLGLGGEEWETSHSAAGVDSSPLFVLATTGFIGLILFANLQLKIFNQGSSLVNASLVAILVHSLFQNSWFYPPVLIWLWAVASLKECS